MLRDKNQVFSRTQALTTGTIVSTDVLDNGANVQMDRDNLRIRVSASAAFVGGTSVQVIVQTDDNVGFSSATAVYTGPAIATAALTLGAVLADIPYPADTERFVRLSYVMVGTYTAGSVDAAVEQSTPTKTFAFADASDRF